MVDKVGVIFMDMMISTHEYDRRFMLEEIFCKRSLRSGRNSKYYISDDRGLNWLVVSTDTMAHTGQA